ncbi:MAG: serine/threonine-protein kinase [Verrucomicrobiota bacterium]
MHQTSAQTLLVPFGWEQRFEMLEKVGAGAMGQVWRARDTVTDRVVALKLLDSSRVGDDQALARLEIEGETLTKLRDAGAHENVVPVIDFKITGEHFCLVMEFIPGLDLKRWCSTHRLSLRERVRLISLASRAAGWFHGLGVVHRDLKPANILVNAVTSQPIIVDFSIAKVEDTLTLTLTNEALGTVPYMAPEQFDRRRCPISPATDVYALGATLYELLTEVPPHPGDMMVIIQRHNDEVRPARPSALNPAISRDLECLLLKSLSHHPADRYADGTEFAEDLDRFLEGRPVRARPVSRLVHLMRQARKRPALSAMVALAIGLGLLAFGSVRNQIREQELFKLEGQITAAMQDIAWPQDSLGRASHLLDELMQRSPMRAAVMRQRLLDDVISDVTSTLQKNHILEGEFTWMHSQAVPWLRKQGRDEDATRLEALVRQCLSRWEVLDELAAPFEHLDRWFPRGEVSLEQGLLRVSHAEKGLDPVVIREGLPLPLKVTAALVVDPSEFRSAGLGISFANVDTHAVFCRASAAPTAVLAALEEPPVTPDDFLLFIQQSREMLAVKNVGAVPMTGSTLQMSLRLETRQIELTINDNTHQLLVDSDAAIGSTHGRNTCLLLWPPGAGLRVVTVSTKQGAASPLEEADLLFLQSRWLDALHLYEALRGDPVYGPEVEHKRALCLMRMNRREEAMGLWRQLSQEPAGGRWRDHAAYQLWAQTVVARGVTAAAPLLTSVPTKLPRSTLWEYGRKLATQVEDKYAREGYGIGFPGVNPARVSNGMRVFQMLCKPTLKTANAFGLVMHMARLDETARQLFDKALRLPASIDLNENNQRYVSNCLDGWLRISPSESTPALEAILKNWCATYPADATFHCIADTEAARRAARGGDLAAALPFVAHTPATAEDRRRVTASLVEGMIHRLQGQETCAQQAWRKGLDLARTVQFRSPVHLCDCVLLHSLTHTWDVESVSGVIGRLMSMNQGSEANQGRSMALSRFQTTFLAAPGFIQTLNSLSGLSSDFSRLAEDYVLCRETPRSLIQSFYRQLLTHWFLATAFPAAPTQADITRTQQAVADLVTEMAVRPDADSADFFSYLQAWNDPAVAPEILTSNYSYPPVLVENLKWLLKQRHRL